MASEDTVSASDPSGGSQSDSTPKKGLPWTRSKQLERDLEHVNKEIYRRNLDLAQTNKTLALLQASIVWCDAEDACNPWLLSWLRGGKVGYPFVAILGYDPLGHHDLEIYGWASGEGAPNQRLISLVG